MKHNIDLELIEVNPSIPPIGTVIWLHGLGADGNDFAPIVPELKIPKTLPIRFIFPHAPFQPVTINGGYIMRAWYDIVSLEVNKHADQKGIEQSVQQLIHLIEREEERDIASERIIVGGFSQGSVIALTTGLTYSKPLGGLLALSGYLPFSDEVFEKASLANKNIPIFLAHGNQDFVVPYFLGEETRKMLTKQNYPVAWHSYAMPHSVCIEEIQDICEWIIQIYMKDQLSKDLESQ